jgi:hypothetical protein
MTLRKLRTTTGRHTKGVIRNTSKRQSKAAKSRCAEYLPQKPTKSEETAQLLNPQNTTIQNTKAESALQ